MEYKGHRLEAASYQLAESGRWVPKVFIEYPTGDSITTKPLTAHDQEHETQAAADGYALTMGQQWVDANT
jgi:hypothetical protein